MKWNFFFQKIDDGRHRDDEWNRIETKRDFTFIFGEEFSGRKATATVVVAGFFK